jgi:hypothetical protein
VFVLFLSLVVAVPGSTINVPVTSTRAPTKPPGFFKRIFQSIGNVGKKLTNFHFEGRVKANGGRNQPTYAEVTAPNSGWTLLPEAMSVFHDNKRVEKSKKSPCNDEN